MIPTLADWLRRGHVRLVTDTTRHPHSPSIAVTGMQAKVVLSEAL
jgi:hypothetical protein